MEENEQPSPGESRKKSLKEIFTYERMFIFLSVFFGAVYLGTAFFGALQLMGVHNVYKTDEQAMLVLTQNLRSMLIIIIPFVLEKIMGFRADLKMITALFLFGVFSTVLGEGFLFYYLDPTHTYDKTLHLIAGIIQLYLAYGFGQYMIRNGNARHKFASALFFAFMASMAIAALWELLEFSSDTLLGTDMQKTIAPDALANGGSTRDPLNGTDEMIAEFYRYPHGYRYGIMDSMVDMVCCLAGTVGCIIFMAVYKKFKKNAFENCVTFSPDYRFKFINRMIGKLKKDKHEDKTDAADEEKPDEG